jgi:hypothetical protein
MMPNWSVQTHSGHGIVLIYGWNTMPGARKFDRSGSSGRARLLRD